MACRPSLITPMTSICSGQATRILHMLLQLTSGMALEWCKGSNMALVAACNALPSIQHAPCFSPRLSLLPALPAWPRSHNPATHPPLQRPASLSRTCHQAAASTAGTALPGWAPLLGCALRHAPSPPQCHPPAAQRGSDWGQHVAYKGPAGLGACMAGWASSHNSRCSRQRAASVQRRRRCATL